MKRISINQRFVNEAGNDLIPGKIHTVRQNYDYWKKFEGQEVALFIWEGKPYRSKQKTFCVKRIVSIQEVEYKFCRFWIKIFTSITIPQTLIAKNDGFEKDYDFSHWFKDYKPGKMAILHFTDFRY